VFRRVLLRSDFIRLWWVCL